MTASRRFPAAAPRRGTALRHGGGARQDPPRLAAGDLNERQLILGKFLLTHNRHPVAITGPHGQSLEWL
ncbi:MULTISPECIES: hypothetical protein [unclassified Arthrobacter]|uniref:hypothetical protein n=1 Tax=unclassified Arthrobacter TaxID=235627 RepID=UPI003394B075